MKRKNLNLAVDVLLGGLPALVLLAYALLCLWIGVFNGRTFELGMTVTGLFGCLGFAGLVVSMLKIYFNKGFSNKLVVTLLMFGIATASIPGWLYLSAFSHIKDPVIEVVMGLVVFCPILIACKHFYLLYSLRKL